MSQLKALNQLSLLLGNNRFPTSVQTVVGCRLNYLTCLLDRYNQMVLCKCQVLYKLQFKMAFLLLKELLI